MVFSLCHTNTNKVNWISIFNVKNLKINVSVQEYVRLNQMLLPLQETYENRMNK